MNYSIIKCSGLTPTELELMIEQGKEKLSKCKSTYRTRCWIGERALATCGRWMTHQQTEYVMLELHKWWWDNGK